MAVAAVKDERPNIIGDITRFTGLHVKGRMPDTAEVSDAKGRFSAFLTGLKERSDPHRQLSVSLDLMMGNVLKIDAYNGEVCAAVFDMSGYNDKRPPRIDIDAAEAKIIFRKLSDMQFQVEQNIKLSHIKGAMTVEKDLEAGYKKFEFKEPEDFTKMKALVEQLEREEPDHDREDNAGRDTPDTEEIDTDDIGIGD